MQTHYIQHNNKIHVLVQTEMRKELLAGNNNKKLQFFDKQKPAICRTIFHSISMTFIMFKGQVKEQYLISYCHLLPS